MTTTPNSPTAPPPVAIIASAHVNAVGISLLLRQARWPGEVHAIGDAGSVAARFGRLCTLWPIGVPEPGDLLRLIVERFGVERRKVVFFTHEIHPPAVLADADAWRAANVRTWVGPATVELMDVVLDRLAFYRFIEQRGLAPVPRTLTSDADPHAEFGERFRARVWRSWDGARKLPRGLSVRTRSDFVTWRRIVTRREMTHDQWGYQELLSTEPTDNVSISGWHDADRRLYLATRKVHQTEENGRIVERIAEPPGMADATRRILDALRYTGPFEMEYIVDPGDGSFKVLELNPRFWMQHRLVAALSDNALVRAYIDDPTLDMRLVESGKRYWLDSDLIADDLLRFRHLWLLRRLGRCVWATPPGESIRRAVRRRLLDTAALVRRIGRKAASVVRRPA